MLRALISTETRHIVEANPGVPSFGNKPGYLDCLHKAQHYLRMPCDDKKNDGKKGDNASSELREIYRFHEQVEKDINTSWFVVSEITPFLADFDPVELNKSYHLIEKNKQFRNQNPHIEHMLPEFKNVIAKIKSGELRSPDQTIQYLRANHEAREVKIYKAALEKKQVEYVEDRYKAFGAPNWQSLMIQYARLRAKEYRLEASGWKPEDGIEELFKLLKTKGALIAGGYFREEYYTKPLKRTARIQGVDVFSVDDTEAAMSPDSTNSEAHAIVIVGIDLQSRRLIAIDPIRLFANGKPDRYYSISLELFLKRATDINGFQYGGRNFESFFLTGNRYTVAPQLTLKPNSSNSAPAVAAPSAPELKSDHSSILTCKVSQSMHIEHYSKPNGYDPALFLRQPIDPNRAPQPKRMIPLNFEAATSDFTPAVAVQDVPKPTSSNDSSPAVSAQSNSKLGSANASPRVSGDSKSISYVPTLFPRSENNPHKDPEPKDKLSLDQEGGQKHNKKKHGKRKG